MKLGIISDVHGNLEALNAVLKEARDLMLICLGDIVGYGASPNECIELVRERASFIIAGNHDLAAVDLIDYANFNFVAKKAISWTRSNLSEENIRYLRSLRLTLSLYDFFAVHSAPCSPESWRYILSPDVAEEEFSCFDQNLCFIGHSHLPFVIKKSRDQLTASFLQEMDLEESSRYIVSVGSVGQPRDGNPAACFCIYDTDEKRIQMKRTIYNANEAADKILKAGLPFNLASRLIHGI